MHAFRRTMLDRMNVNDFDRSMPEHDAICVFLTDPANAESLVRSITGCDKVSVDSVSLEHPLCKGTGQYKTTVGFVDVVITGRIRKPDGCTEPFRFGVEVKTSPDRIGNLLRQINLYREYSPSWRWALVTTFTIDESATAALLSQKIHVVDMNRIAA